MALGLFWATVALCVFLSVLALDTMGVFTRKNQFDVEGKTVVITGGSQGMGRALARLLAQKGANVVIVARAQSKLDDALQYISSAAKRSESQRFLAISADVTKAEENTRILIEVTQWNDGQPPDVVWANAGGSWPSLFIDTPMETQRAQMDLNFWSAAYLAQATLQLWFKTTNSKQPDNAKVVGPRHFIMTSSLVAFVGLAGYAPYAPGKAALRSLADSLRSEVNLYNGFRQANRTSGPKTDVQIHCVCPGTITSPGLIEENKVKHPVTLALEKDDTQQSEDEVAAAAVKALESGGYLITTHAIGGLMRAASLGGSPRNNWVLDTATSWIASVVWLFVGPNLEATVFDYGKKNYVHLPA